MPEVAGTTPAGASTGEMTTEKDTPQDMSIPSEVDIRPSGVIPGRLGEYYIILHLCSINI